MGLSRILMVLLLCAPFFFASPAAEAKRKKEIHYVYTWIPEVGYQFGFTELTGSFGLVHGPTAGAKLVVDNEGIFVFPDASLTLLLGLESTVLSWTAGGGIGLMIENGTIGLWGGLSYVGLISYRSVGSPEGRLGAFFPVGEEGAGHKLGIELDYSAFPIESTVTSGTVVTRSVTHYSYIGAKVTYSL